MSDCESPVTDHNIITFQNVNTTVNARGPYTNIENLRFRNHMASSMCMPRNFERQNYTASVSDQRSIYYRRATSPRSTYSMCDIRPRNFQRSGSPMSVRTIDSSASLTSADIAFAIKNVEYTEYDLKVIKDAFMKRMKQYRRKRIEKRRNKGLVLKGIKHRSDDSGEQGSDSSISSDDSRSVKTSCKENTNISRMGLSNFRKTIKDSNLLIDNTENVIKHSFTNLFTHNSSNFNRSHNLSQLLIPKQQHSISTQKDKFKNSFVLPSQRFNRSVASSVIQENSFGCNKYTESEHRKNSKLNHPTSSWLNNDDCENDSDEEIFSSINRTVKNKNIDNSTLCNQTVKNVQQRKRSLHSENDPSLPDKKKSKMASPVKNVPTNRNVPSKARNINHVNSNNENSYNFEFAKPMLPVKKSKPKTQEKVIAKSKQPLTGYLESAATSIVNASEIISHVINQEEPEITHVDNQDSSQIDTVSLRPSFIKRKLFTQKLGAVYKQANLSNDSINSPQSNGYSALQKQKNKTRKLVTNQSCLNRDVQDDNNLLDLIHRIVPQDSMNITKQSKSNQIKTDNNGDHNDNRWDVTSVISLCNDTDVSDTFTDEEIFKIDNKNNDSNNNSNSTVTNKESKNTKTNKHIEKIKTPECVVIAENLNKWENMQKPADKKSNISHANVSKTVSKNTFWDTDFETDTDCHATLQKSYVKGNPIKDNNALDVTKPASKHTDVSCTSKNLNSQSSIVINDRKTSNIMNSTLVTRKFNISSLSVRSHRTSKKKCINETCIQEMKPTPRIENTHSKKMTPSFIETNKKTVVNSNNKTIDTLSKPTKSAMPNSKKQNFKKSRSTPLIRKSPRIKSKMDTIKSKMEWTNSFKKTQNKVNNNLSIYLSPSNRPIRSCRVRSQDRSLQ